MSDETVRTLANKLVSEREHLKRLIKQSREKIDMLERSTERLEAIYYDLIGIAEKRERAYASH